MAILALLLTIVGAVTVPAAADASAAPSPPSPQEAEKNCPLTPQQRAAVTATASRARSVVSQLGW